MTANATDQRLFFSRDLGRRIRLGVDNTARFTSDALGAITPGRYVVQGVGLGANTMGVTAIPFVDGAAPTHTIPAAPAAGVTDLADGILLTAAVPSFVLHVKKDVNDRLVAIMSAGAATLELTKTGS